MHATFDSDSILSLRLWQMQLLIRAYVSTGRIAHCEGPRPDFACPYIRVSFASATDADLVEGIRRLATVIRKFEQESSVSHEQESSASHANGVADSNGSASTHVAASNRNTAHGNTENGNSKHSVDRSVQEVVHDNEQMSLNDAVHTAADSQPEGC